MKRAFLFVMSAMLAGCAAFPESAPAPRGASAAVLGAEIGEEPQFVGQEDGDSAAMASVPQLDTVPRPKKKPPSIAAVRPDALVGLTPEEVEALIGRPVAKAEQPPATVWHYRANNCALEVFFYMDVGSKTFRALTFNMKRPNGEDAPPSLCLRQIRAVSYGS